MPEKRLYENKENLYIYIIVKFGYYPNYDGFEPKF